MNYLSSKRVFQDISNPSSSEKSVSDSSHEEPETKSWDQVENSIDCAIKTVENAMRATSCRNERNLSIPLRRLYNRSKKLRLARGKVLKEDKLDEENYINGRCMLGKFISGAC